MIDFLFAMIATVASSSGSGAPTTSGAPEAAEAPPAFLAPEAGSAIPAFPTPELVAEPQVATGRFLTALEVKPILNATRANWVSVREFNGQDLLYVTHIWAWRCGLLRVRVGVNGAPLENWTLPECHEDHSSPNAILECDGVPYRAFELGRLSALEVELTFDDLSVETAQFTREAILMR